MAAEHIHPIVVHFVIAPLTIASVFDFVWLLSKKENFQKFSWYNLIIASIFSLLAVITGLMAEENITFSVTSQDIFEIHENLAFLLIVFLLIQFLWRFANKGKIPQKYQYIYIFVAILSLIFVITTSYFGGKLVFNYGIGVKIENTIKKNIEIPTKKTQQFQFIEPDSSDK